MLFAWQQAIGLFHLHILFFINFQIFTFSNFQIFDGTIKPYTAHRSFDICQR